MLLVPIIISSHTIMKSLTPAQQPCILSLLDKGESGYKISSITDVSTSSIPKLCSKHHSTLSKSIGGHPSKFSPANIHYAICLVTTQKAENTVQITKTLQDLTNQSISSKAVLKMAGMKAVVNSVATVQFCLVQRGVFVNPEPDHGFSPAKLSNAELNAVESVQGIQFRFIGSSNQN